MKDINQEDAYGLREIINAKDAEIKRLRRALKTITELGPLCYGIIQEEARAALSDKDETK